MTQWGSTPSGIDLKNNWLAPINGVQSVVSVLLSLLNIALSVLQVIKAFAIGLTDPFTAVLEALIAELEGLINDLRKVGVYAHGDWYLLEWPLDQLKGGFNAYEGRMLRRLTDVNDPNRPSFTPATNATAVFFYTSAPIEQVEKILRLVNALVRLFQYVGEENNGLPRPINLEVGYGADNGTLFQTFPLDSLSLVAADRTLHRANLSWKIPPSEQQGAVPKPYGFLIEMSVYPQGLNIAWSSPVSDNTASDGAQDYVTGYYLDANGRPLVLYGGSDQFVLPTGYGWNTAYGISGLEPSARQIYAVRDPADTTPIPLELLKDGDTHLIQRTLYVPVRASTALSLNRVYGFKIQPSDLPKTADFEATGNGSVRVVPGSVRDAEAVYVRVRAVSRSVDSATAFRYSFLPVIDATTNAYAETIDGVSASDVGDPSDTVIVQFPTERESTYLLSLQAALVVMLLSRSDVDSNLVSKGTGLEPYASAITESIVGDRFFRKNRSAKKFRSQILARAEEAALRIYQSTVVPDAVKNQVIEAGTRLLAWKWSDADPSLPSETILESLQSESIRGLCANYLSIHNWSDQDSLTLRIANAMNQRNAGILSALDDSDFLTREIVDEIPVFFNMQDPGDLPLYVSLAYTTGSVVTCRTLLNTVYSDAMQVLQLAASALIPVEGGWIRFQLMPRGLPGIDKLFDEVLHWANTLKLGTRGFSDMLLEYVEFYEARIRELQELLERLDFYIGFFDRINIPSASVLVVNGAGVNGIIEEFLKADNKPEDSPEDYGAGVVYVAGGIPSLLAEFLQSIAGG